MAERRMVLREMAGSQAEWLVLSETGLSSLLHPYPRDPVTVIIDSFEQCIVSTIPLESHE